MDAQPSAKERLEQKLFPKQPFYQVLHMPVNDNDLWVIQIEHSGHRLGKGTHRLRAEAEEQAAAETLSIFANDERRSRSTPLKHLFKQVAEDRGRLNELALQKILEDRFSRSKPDWLLSMRRATRKEDRQGIDLVFKSDVGDLFLQVKSSMSGVRKFMEKKRLQHIEVIIVQPDMQAEGLAKHAISLLEKQRELILAPEKA